MAALYLDECVPNAAVQHLEQYGHSVTHARIYRKSASDDEQILIAADNGWTMITSNERDFILLHRAWLRWSSRWGVSPQHAGILLTRNTWLEDVLAERVNAYFAEQRDMTNRLFRWADGRGWEERT